MAAADALEEPTVPSQPAGPVRHAGRLGSQRQKQLETRAASERYGMQRDEQRELFIFNSLMLVSFL